MNVREQLAADMGAAIAIYGETFEWGGRVLPCVRRDSPTMRELQDEGGYIDRAQFFLVVAKSHFPGGAFPADGDAINSSAYQIKNVAGHKDPAAVQLTLAIGTFDE